MNKNSAEYISEMAINIYDQGRKDGHDRLKNYLLECAEKLDFNGDSPNIVIRELISITEENSDDNE